MLPTPSGLPVNAAGGLLWLAATAVGHQGIFSVRRHHRAARKPRLTRAKANRAPPPPAAPRRAAPCSSARARARAHAARVRYREATLQASFEPGAKRSSLEPRTDRPPPLAVLTKASKKSPGSYTRIRLAASAMSSRAPSSRRCANSHLEGHSFSGIATHLRRWSSAQ